ncbi:MAG: putative porin [Myroides odoratus]|jgi:hypothetical protein|nr:putative porin [Myroides odoratus]
MRKYLYLVFCFLSFGFLAHAQFQPTRLDRGNTTNFGDPNDPYNNFGNQNNQNPQEENNEPRSLREKVKKDSIAPIKDYKIITILRDTIAVDTALTLKSYYKFNYLRKDNFGLLPFANEGQTYATLKYSQKVNNVLPGFGFEAKHFNYMKAEDITYHSSPTPRTELYYKTVMKQGQSLDAFITLNTSEHLNMFLAYKGMRSLGKYMSQLSSTGNFRIGWSYYSPNKRYVLFTHFVAQDILNQENGGITDLDLFETSEKPYNKRERLNVYFRDGESLLKGKRLFLHHEYQLNSSLANGILLTHEFTYEDKFFEYYQKDLNSTYTQKDRFGASFKSTISNKTKYYTLSNKVGAAFQSGLLGRVEVYADFYKYNYQYNSVANINGGFIPNLLEKNMTLIGGKYTYKKENWNAFLLVYNSLGNDNTSNIQANIDYALADNIGLQAGYQKLSRMGNLNYYLYQSDYLHYNWNNSFNNEKINQFDATLTTPWVTLEGSYQVIKDKLYFSNDNPVYNDFGIAKQLLITPKQYGKTINFLSLQASKEIKFGRFGLDNTILYQEVDQEDNILNVPKLLTRNTLYYKGALFDKALKFQTGITFTYFSKFYGNDYNPVIGDFYVQDKVKIGDYPVFDFFIDMKVRTARIYLILEHFNASMSGYKYYTAPNYPYKDFTFRFGLVWNFFS